MVLQCLRKDQDIIKINQNEVAQLTREHLVDKSLKCCGGVCKTEWHECELVQPPACPEGRLGNVCWLHPDLMVAACKVELGKVPHLAKSVN